MTRRTSRVGLLLAVVAPLSLLAPSEADARTVRDQPYSFTTTWNAAVRLLRVDFGFTITERDPDIGYLTFTYREGAQSVPGSLELVRSNGEGLDGTRVIVSVPLMPTYVEAMIHTRLGRKLREEFGDPPTPRRPTPPSAPPVHDGDAGVGERPDGG